MNKDIVGKWFETVWGKHYHPGVIDRWADPHVVMQYPLHDPCEGPDVIKTMLNRLRTAFPDLHFSIVRNLIAVYEMSTTHSRFFTKPQELVDILLQIAAQ